MNRRAVLSALLLAAAAAAPAVLPARAAGPTPTIDAINPSEGSVSGGTVVTITGTDFTPPMEVLFDGVPAGSVTVVSETQLTCTTPAHARGAVDVIVSQITEPRTNSDPAVDAFTYLESPAYTWIPRARGADTGGNPGGLDLVVVDTANRRVAASLDLNPTDLDLPDDQEWRPTQVLFDATGEHAFVATAGTPGALDSRKLFVVKTARLLGTETGDPILAVIDTAGNPYQAALSGSGSTLYLVDGGSWEGSSLVLPDGSFRAYDVTDRANPSPAGAGSAATGVLPVLSYAVSAYQGWGTNSSFRGTVQSRSGRTVITNAGAATLTVLDLQTLAVLGTVDVGVPGGGAVQLTSSIPSPFSDDFVFVQTTDVASGDASYFVYRISADDLLEKGTVPVPVRFFPVLPFPDLQNRLVWPHSDGESLVTVPATDASVAAFNPATGSAQVRTAIQGGGPPTSLAYNDTTGYFYAREADGGWTVLSVPETTTGGAAPVVAETVADLTGIASLRVVGNGSTLVGTATSSVSFVAGTAGSTGAAVHQVEETLALPLDPDGGGVFPQPMTSGAGGPRTFVQVVAGGLGPQILVPLPGSVFCAGEEPPQFEFTPGISQAARFELEIGSQYDFLRGPGAATRRRKAAGGASTVTPGPGMWRRVLRAAAGSVERPLYARVNAVVPGGGRVHGETVSFGVCPPEPCTALAPADGASATRAAVPAFSFETAGQEKFWIELAGPGGFDGGRVVRARVRGDLSGATATAEIGRGKWRRAVDRARRDSGGFPTVVTWRVRCVDFLRRETFSEERSLTVQP